VTRARLGSVLDASPAASENRLGTRTPPGRPGTRTPPGRRRRLKMGDGLDGLIRALSSIGLDKSVGWKAGADRDGEADPAAAGWPGVTGIGVSVGRPPAPISHNQARRFPAAFVDCVG
jgi:hypothetical protein